MANNGVAPKKYLRFIVFLLVAIGVAAAATGLWQKVFSPSAATVASAGEPAGASTSDDVAAASNAASSDATEVVVYKSPTCGCCHKWEDHLRANGFKVTSRPTDDMQTIKKEQGVPSDLSSCHTAVVGGYVVEGHVPAATLQKLLKEKPAVAGIAVPGMPIGSPGMEGHIVEKYDVISYDSSGTRKVFASH